MNAKQKTAKQGSVAVENSKEVTSFSYCLKAKTFTFTNLGKVS
jgi:hypothetical protein